MNIANHLADVVRRTPEHSAILAPRITNGALEEYTYAQLASLVEGYANGFFAQGIKKGDKVLVLIPLSVDLYAVMIALFKIGATGVLYEPKEIRWQLNATLPSLEVNACITSPRINMFLWSVRAYRNIPLRVLTHRSGVPRFGATIISIENTQPVPERDLPPDTPALITFTSGSEGTPKGICRTHEFLNTQHAILQNHMHLTSEDRILTSLPVFVLSMLAAGSFAIIPPLKKNLPWKPETERTMKLIHDKHVTMFLGSSAFITPLVQCAKEKGIRFETVKRAMVGGCFLEIALIDLLRAVLAPNATIEVIYGSTEVEPVAVASIHDITQSAHYGYEGYCVGTPIPDVRARIVPFVKGNIAAMPKPLGIGEIGELIVSGKHVNERYTPQEPAWSMNKIVEGKNIWHRMGDGAYLDTEGRIWLVGRFKHLPDKILHQYPEYLHLEGALKKQGLARRVTVVQAHNGIKLIVENTANIFTKRNMKKKIRELCAVHHIEPTDIIIKRQLPLDRRHNSKVDYGKVKALVSG